MYAFPWHDYHKCLCKCRQHPYSGAGSISASKRSGTAYKDHRKGKKADIPFKTLGLEDLTVDHQLTGEIQPIYKKNVEDAREKYRDAGYQNVRCIGAIITRISPDDFYAMTLQFFGDTMDLDFAREQRLAKEKSDAFYESSYKDWLPEGTLPVCDNKNK